MKVKLREYIDTIFADAERRAPYNQRVRELKEEMLQNLNDRYDDLVSKGKSPAAAYNIAIAGVGDVSELLDSVVGGGNSANENGNGGHAEQTAPPKSSKRPLTAEEQETVRRYKERSAILTSVAVAMYILCWLPTVIFEILAGDKIGDALGLVIMFGMIAGATVMLIYNSMTKPKFGPTVVNWDKDDDDDDDDDDEKAGKHPPVQPVRPRRSPVYKAISGALFVLVLCGYLLVSFATGAWHITWLIFLMYAALDNVIKAIFDLRR